MTDIHQQNLFAPEQFRISRLQVFNWGTFDNLHDIPISERGFLFVGRSGSGKSTLLDAFSALLVPPKWIDFNAAAREADKSSRDRNFVSYIRGAWADQKDNESGEIATQYLRPGTAWSALALTYRKPQGETVVLVQLFWLRGKTNSNADVRRHFLIFQRPFDLQELKDFDLNIRALKQQFSDAHHYDEFRPYCERFSRILGIETEIALRLLHKTQSAKNLGDLNTFLRDFMLDKPPTFEAAERLVAEFSELNSAHQTVVIAREQVQTLTPAREEYHQMELLKLEKNALDELRMGIDHFQEMQRYKLLEEEIKSRKVESEGTQGAITNAENQLANQCAALRDLEHQQNDMGGGRIVQWEEEKTSLETQLQERSRKQRQTESACSRLGWHLPATPQGFAELVGKARQELIDAEQHAVNNRDEQFNLVRQKKDVEETFTSSIREVKALKRQPSNIPAGMLELRASIATALGLHETALPFVGELIEVRAEENAWQGAIERVLRGFSLSLLVEETHYAALSNFINQSNLGKRLVYFRVGQAESVLNRVIDVNSLIHKLNIKSGKYFDWINAELKKRFDFMCVESIQAFRHASKALTREGQIRHGKEKHEKDDRYHVDDRSNWVLGFDNREKLALFEQRAQALADQISQLDKKISQFSKNDRERAERDLQCQILANTEWQEIDVSPLLMRISTIKKQLSDFRAGNTALQKLEQSIAQQKQFVEKAENHLRDLKVTQLTTTNIINSYLEELSALKKKLIEISLTPFQQNGLTKRFHECTHKLLLSHLSETTKKVERKLAGEIEALISSYNKLDKSIESRFADFKRKWPMETSDVDASIASAPDFFAKLSRLETDGLPQHEQRFFELLQSQSHQNLAALSTHLNQARKAIMERMALVNESLGSAEFNSGTYLYIDVSDRQLVEVREFKQKIQQALEHAWTDDHEHAEARFQVLSKLVQQLGGQESDQRRWREAVLDVRLHVEFIGRERDKENREVEVYRSGAGKSGGQRQKLATTCLAAALRYQLGGKDRHIPMYAPVILDEAFDKADNEFTALAMNIFANFGFQMIVATPLKSVMTLEPFIGGACFVDIRDRRYSSALSLAYDTEHQRLHLTENKDVKIATAS
jgi:uncharacterized protein YPO0396